MKESVYCHLGMNFCKIDYVNNRNKYHCYDKELIDQAGMDCYDYGARFYDAALGRFTCLDPAADQFAFVSPYNYAENSPIANIDLWGLQAWSATKNAAEEMSEEDYQEYVKKKTDEMVNAEDVEENQFDCADFCITVLVSYFKEKGVQFKMKIGNKTIDSNDSKYSGETAFEDFVEDVKLVANTDNLRNPNVSEKVNEDNMKTGDLINSGSHVRLFLEKDNNSDRPIKAAHASGLYYGKGNPENSTILPGYVEYKKVPAQPYRWSFLNDVPSTNADANKIKVARKLWGE